MKLPSEAAVFDFATGGLDLAHEVMRGYDALVLVDISRQGGEPGTLYVMEADEHEIAAGIEAGRAFAIACEPLEAEDMGLGLSEPVAGAVDGAVALVLETVESLRTDAAYATE